MPAKGVEDRIWKIGLRNNFSYRKNLKHNFKSPLSFEIKAKCYRRKRFFIVVLEDPNVEGKDL